jgi:hypothetical protein
MEASRGCRAARDARFLRRRGCWASLAVMATKAAGDPIDVSLFSDQIRRDFRNSPGGR